MVQGPPIERNASRWRRARRALEFVLGVLFVVGTGVGVAWGAYRYALASPRFAIRSIDVEGSRRFGPAEVSQIAGIHPGINAFALDIRAAERRLAADPWIESAKITRRLPSRLSVQLSENEPVALAALGDRLFLLTPQGVPFKRFAVGDPHDLPLVTGMTDQELGGEEGSVRIGTALAVLRQYERLRMSKAYPAQEVHMTDAGAVVLVVGASGIALFLGEGPWPKKLQMAERAFGLLAAKGQVPETVFLDNRAHPERVVVRVR
ncbi:MAG TPA: FtsQ-type POTRA domain-containing protein [Polyangiaceae bacterium]